jgi:hypothetical protein
MRIMRKTMHGSYRKAKAKKVAEAVQHRSDEYAAGRQGKPIASWTNKPARAPPMRSTIVDMPDGSQRTAVEPADVRHTAEDKFKDWFDGVYGPSECTRATY